jgi:hypothetical protein
MAILVFVLDLILRKMLKIEISGKEKPRKNLVTESGLVNVKIEGSKVADRFGQSLTFSS